MDDSAFQRTPEPQRVLELEQRRALVLVKARCSLLGWRLDTLLGGGHRLALPSGWTIDLDDLSDVDALIRAATTQ